AEELRLDAVGDDERSRSGRVRTKLRQELVAHGDAQVGLLEDASLALARERSQPQPAPLGLLASEQRVHLDGVGNAERAGEPPAGVPEEGEPLVDDVGCEAGDPLDRLPGDALDEGELAPLWLESLRATGMRVEQRLDAGRRRAVPGDAHEQHVVSRAGEGVRELQQVDRGALPLVRDPDAEIGADDRDPHQAWKSRCSARAALSGSCVRATHARPATPSDRPPSGSWSSRSIAAARASGSSGGTRSPVSPSRTSSGMPATSVETTGSPRAIASSCSRSGPSPTISALVARPARASAASARRSVSTPFFSTSRATQRTVPPGAGPCAAAGSATPFGK